MGDYRDEREAALQRAEVLSRQNAQLQSELDALRGGGPRRPGTTRVPWAVAGSVGAMVVIGASVGLFTAARRGVDSTSVAPSLELRGRWTPPAPVARVGFRAAVRAGGGTWAVGDGGSIYFRGDSPGAWAPVPSGTDADLYAITSGDPLVVVGARGAALRFDAAQRRWIAESTGTAADLHAIASRQGALIVVGAGGTMLQRATDGVWTAVPSGVTNDLHAIAVSPTDRSMVVVGAGGVILGAPLEGGPFTRQASPVTATLRAVAAWNSSLLAVGEHGVVVSTTSLSPWTVVRAGLTADLYAVAATEIPYEERRPGYSGSGSTYGFVAAGAGGTVLVDRLGSIVGWRAVRAGGGAIRAMTSEPWGFFTADGTVIEFSPR